MEAIVAVLHVRKTLAREQLHIAQSRVEVEVARGRSQCASRRVAYRHLDVVRSPMDIFRDV